MSTQSQTCAKCKAPIADDAVFCSKCGLNLTLEHSRVGFVDAALDDGEVDQALRRLRKELSDRYDVQRELGRGGMATVFLARDLKHDREVAIKVLHPDLALSLGGERFLREIRLAAKLQHPHILGLYDSGASGDLMYYMMPFVKGESLRDKLNREGMLPIDEALQITIEVAGALGFAHAQGIVHRDIKPENILLSGDHALVADFGIASAVSDVGTQKLTQTGMAVGTPVYMAPEQSSGEVTGPTADLYSLGCMLYEMLAGEPPFTGANPMAIMARHLMEQVPSIRIVRNAVPEEVEQTIFFALQKMPVDRPQTAAQFIEALSVSVGGTAMMRATRTSQTFRRPTTEVATMPRPWWRRPAVIGSVAALLVATATSLWALFGRDKKPATSTLGEDARRIAVLYFQDLSKDSSLAPIANGLTEGLIHTLSTSPSLSVISSSGVEAYRNTELPIDSIARILRVGYVVRGEMEPEGDRVRLAVRIDDASGVSLNRGGFTVSRDSLLASQDSLATLAAGLIKAQLGEELRLKEERASTTSETAWLLTQRGAQLRKKAEAANNAGDTAGASSAYLAADSMFAAAEIEDPKWSEPISRRAALALSRARVPGIQPAEIRKWVAIGVGHADRALAVNASDADALEMRGTLNYWSWMKQLETGKARRQAQILSAKADLEKSTTINRLQASAFASLSHLYYNAPNSTTNDVFIAAQRALDADEFLSNANLVLQRLFNASYDLGNFDRAEQYCASLQKRFPADFRSTRCQLYLLTKPQSDNRDLARAWRLADSLVAMGEDRQEVDMFVAAVLAQAAKGVPSLADSARRVARRSEGDATTDPTRENAYVGAFVFTTLGDIKDAVRLLKAFIAANPDKAGSLRDDPGWWFRPLEENGEFRALVSAVP